jgi:glycosyltransferase involved in cell wall biosynthesis
MQLQMRVNQDIIRNNKILFVIHGLGIGGSEMFFVNLVNGFKKKGYQPIVVLLSEHNPILNKLDPEVPYHILKRRFRYDLSVSGKIRSIIQSENIKKVFCVELFSFFLSKRLFLFNQEVRFFLSVHNSIPITKKAYTLDLIYLRFFQKNDRVIFVCNFQKDCYKERYYFRPRNSYVIYNGINVSHYSRTMTTKELNNGEMSWKSRMGLSELDKTILIIGRLAQEKGHLYAIKALQHLHTNLGLHAHLVIVGGGTADFENMLTEAANKSGVQNYIHFVGSQKEVRPYLYYADVFSLTSFSETFSIAALEALSMGVPCSLTKVGGAPEMIVNENIGTLCESRNEASMADSWNLLLRKEPDREYISRYAVESFSFDKMLKNYLEVIN